MNAHCAFGVIQFAVSANLPLQSLRYATDLVGSVWTDVCKPVIALYVRVYSL